MSHSISYTNEKTGEISFFIRVNDTAMFLFGYGYGRKENERYIRKCGVDA